MKSKEEIEKIIRGVQERVLSPNNAVSLLLEHAEQEAIAFAEWIVENEWKKNWRADKSEYQWQQFSLHSNPKRDYKTTAELFAIWKGEGNG